MAHNLSARCFLRGDVSLLGTSGDLCPCRPDKEARVLFKQVREAQGLKNFTALTDEDNEFLMLVEELRGPHQGKGSKAFWEEVIKRWHTKTGQLYGNWRGPKKRHKSLQERLEE